MRNHVVLRQPPALMLIPMLTLAHVAYAENTGVIVDAICRCARSAKKGAEARTALRAAQRGDARVVVHNAAARSGVTRRTFDMRARAMFAHAYTIYDESGAARGRRALESRATRKSA